ncbi:exosortase N [Flavitalea antarctica]
MRTIQGLNRRFVGLDINLRGINFYFSSCIIFAFVGAAFAFPLSYLSSTNVTLGLVIAPVSLYCSTKKRFNGVYFLAMVVFATVSYTYEVKIFYFFALAFFLLTLLELYVGKCDKIILFLFLFMSPFFHQVIAIMGFPIRLGLSAVAGNILMAAGVNVEVEGNLMVLNGSAFSVDEACMGLNMLSTSMLMAVFSLGYRYRIHKNRLSFSKLILFFSIVFLLNIVCNLLRIIVLVAFRIEPEDPMHEIIGLLCFSSYIMVPVFFLSSWMIRKARIARVSVHAGNAGRSFLSPFLFFVSLILLSLGVYLNIIKHRNERFLSSSIVVPGFESAAISDGITKLFNRETLVYIKPIPEFFSGEHTPLICWRGGGYSFKGVKKSAVNGVEVYTGKLSRPGEVLFTAWWYSNGKTITISQLDWRFRMLKGEEKFRLVNVTVGDEASLVKSIQFFMNQEL